MTWNIDFTERSRKAFKQLDKPVQLRITRFLSMGVAPNPRRIGEAMSGGKKGFWRYRVGDYRVIVEIADQELLVLVVQVGKRGDVYRVKL